MEKTGKASEVSSERTGESKRPAMEDGERRRKHVFVANTGSATLSMRLKLEIKKRLAKLAKASGRSANFLISEAVEA